MALVQCRATELVDETVPIAVAGAHLEVEMIVMKYTVNIRYTTRISGVFPGSFMSLVPGNSEIPGCVPAIYSLYEKSVLHPDGCGI